MENKQPSSSTKAVKGYKMVVIFMTILLALVSFMYLRQVNQIKAEFAIERDTLTNRMSALMHDFQDLETENTDISLKLDVQRHRADSIMQQLSKERSLSRSKIRQYEKELGTLRSVMRGFVAQIDSLNTLNLQLIEQNITYRKQVTTESLRADKAEEKAGELSVKIRQGAVIKARNIAIMPLSTNDKEVTRASRAARLRVDFVLSANELTAPGERMVYAQITGPDGYIMAKDAADVFDFEGDKLTFSAAREVDYQNQDLPVGLYYNGAGIVGGKYRVDIYIDGYKIGTSELVLK
ncbi:MAG: hypothetical protein R3Y38_04525 [Rikenellaceae bacterium]